MLTYTWKILVCALSVVIGSVLGSMMFAALGLRSPQMPPAVDGRLLALSTLVASVVLSIGLSVIPVFWPIIGAQKRMMPAQLQLARNRVRNAIDVWRGDLKGERFQLDGEDITA